MFHPECGSFRQRFATDFIFWARSVSSVVDEVTLERPRALIFRERTQLLGAVAVAVVAPFLARFGVNPAVHVWDQADTSLLVLVGILASHVFLKKFALYPAQDPFSTVIPAVSASFAAILLLITAGHLDYSRALLFMGFVMTLVWYGGVAALRARLLRPRLAVIPLGTGRELPALARAEWRTLREPLPAIRPHAIDGVVVDLTHDIGKDWEGFVVDCAARGIPIYDSTRTREFMTGEVDLARAGDIGVDALHPQRSYTYLKSVVDVAAALVLLPVVLLVLGALAVVIRIDSPGPVLFVQKRMGYRGRIFNCYKLRSMHADAHRTGPSFTASADPRITRVGRFIRKYRLDELPQVFNILKGEMSWIGPRPEAVELALEYGRHIPYYAFRHSVKPGITGWAAIRQGNVAEVEEATRKLRHDFFYIKNISASLDAFITVKTIWIVLTGFGSR